MQQQMILENKDTINIWNIPITEESNNSNNYIHQINNNKIAIKAFNLRQTSINQMLELQDSKNKRVFGIYFNFSGEITGQCVVIIEPVTAYKLIDMITNNPVGTTKALDHTEEAITGEMGNIISSILLNEITNIFKIDSQPNPSIVLYDTVEALYDIACVEIVRESDNIYILETVVLIENNEIEGKFLLMFNPDVISAKLGEVNLLRPVL